mgnify:CR=1 FL=1
MNRCGKSNMIFLLEDPKVSSLECIKILMGITRIYGYDKMVVHLYARKFFMDFDGLHKKSGVLKGGVYLQRFKDGNWDGHIHVPDGYNIDSFNNVILKLLNMGGFKFYKDYIYVEGWLNE